MLVFVYGSLKRGFSNHHFLHGQPFVGEAKTTPSYRMFDYGGFPAVVPSPQNGRSIEGELFEIDAETLVRLDWLEEIDAGLYRRGSTRLLPPMDRHGDVLIYLYERDVSQLPDAGTVWTHALDTGDASEIP